MGGQKLWPMKIGSIRFFFLLLVDGQRWSLRNFHCANVDESAEKRNTAAFSIFSLSFISLEGGKKGVRDPRNVHVLRGIPLMHNLFHHFNVKRFTRVSRSHLLYTPCLNHRWPSEIRLQEMAWRGIGEDSASSPMYDEANWTSRYIQHLAFSLSDFFPFFSFSSLFFFSLSFFFSLLGIIIYLIFSGSNPFFPFFLLKGRNAIHEHRWYKIWHVHDLDTGFFLFLSFFFNLFVKIANK